LALIFNVKIENPSIQFSMRPMTHALTEPARRLLRSQGSVASSTELQQLLGVSQPTVSRALAPLIQAGTVRKVGAARAQRYVLSREVVGVGREVPIMRVDHQGRAAPFARMLPLEGGAFWVDEVDGVHARHDGLPWFLDDMRPQGFMGRTFAHAHPELQLGGDPSHWNDDDVLRALALFGDDLPGNLIVGDAAFQRFHSLAERASRVASAADYPALADQAMQGTHPGSSAGGEQPKFCTVCDGRPVLVKFSPADDSPVAQRLRDLLVCEHLALQTLATDGVAAAPTQVFRGGGRVFMESERFDRSVQQGRIGRVGMVSLQVYDAEYVGEMDNWAATAQRMAGRQLLRQRDADTLCLLEAYGVLIANTDRHYGNVSLLIDAQGDWALAPCYDMLPMLYAPVGNELVARDFAARPLQPSAATLPFWDRAMALAQTFWRAAAQDPRISADFRAVAAQNAQHLAQAA
jgi:hypothetical protein